MVGMAVIDANHIEAPAPRIVVGVQQLKGIDDVAADAVLGRHVLRTTRFEHAPRFFFMADEETAALLREVFTGVPFDVADDSDGDLDYVRSSQ
jgi:hypothetical protein